jgi:hypothetical protein
MYRAIWRNGLQVKLRGNLWRKFETELRSVFAEQRDGLRTALWGIGVLMQIANGVATSSIDATQLTGRTRR